MTIVSLFTDGGIIHDGTPGGSKIGGGYAYTLVDEQNQRVVEFAKVITPIEVGLPEVTNNLTELLALVRGMMAMPTRQPMVVYSDSWVSLQRVFINAKLNNVPAWLVRELRQVQDIYLVGDYVKYVLLDGHPTQKHLAAGKGKRGQPVSEHNRWADMACQNVQYQYVELLKRGWVRP